MRETSLPRPVRVLVSTLVLGLGLMPQTAVPAQAADATLVFAAEQAIVQNHVERPHPIKLLAGALTGLRQALTKVGIAERLADLTAADEASARAEFQARFDRAVALGQGKLTATQLQYAAAAAMAASVGDCCTSFFTPEQWERLVMGRLTGIGIQTWYKRDRFVLFTIAPYSPAASAGLRPFDRVLAVDGQSVQGMTQENIASRIRGPEGTTVKLTIRRPGQRAPLSFSIVRQRIQRFPPIEHRMLDGRLGYIWIRGLRGSSDSAEFRRTLVGLQREGMRGLILDLRSDPGRNYLEGLLVANALLSAGVPIQTLLSHAKDVGKRARPEACPVVGRETLNCTDITSGGTLLEPSTPLVVLIDEQTSETGETLSAAIRATRRGKLLGVRTAGHVGRANSVDLPGGNRILVKTHIVLAGTGVVIDKIGVQPDVIVEVTAQDIDHGVDTQLQRAVEMLAR